MEFSALRRRLVLHCAAAPLILWGLPGQTSAQSIGDIAPLRPIVAAGVNLLALPDAPDIVYFGVRGELPLSDPVSYSGAVYIGPGSDGRTYLHLPTAGFVISLPYLAWLSFLEWLTDEQVPPAPEWFKYLLLENLHLNIPAGQRVTLSPYLNLLSFDGEVHSGEEEENFDALGAMSAGIGLTVKLSLSDRLVIAPDFSFRRYFLQGDQFGGDDRFGYFVGIHLGVVF